MITDAQTDTVFISKQTFQQHPRITQRIIRLLKSHNVPCELLLHTNDSWCRDYMPIQTSRNRFIQYYYFPDYLRNNSIDIPYITDPTQTLQDLGIETIKTDIIIDGGNVIKCDDCVIMTEKVVEENRRNYSKVELIAQLESLFQCEVLLIYWDKMEKYGHADGVVRFIRDKEVLMTNYYDFDPASADKIANQLSKKFNVHTLSYNTSRPHRHSWAYINYLQTSQLIVIPAFNTEEDAQAHQQITQLFPDYADRIFSVPITGIANEGGALNCITWNILSD